MIVDGSTNWGKGGPRPAAKGFEIEARRNSIYEWVRQVRGGVLAGAFTVERHLSAAIIHFMLGERMALPEVQEAFDEGLLAPLTFERRINVALMVAAHVLPADQVKNLKSQLSELRSLRNSMAHRPFWFHPELNAAGEVENLVPMVMRGKGPMPLTTKLVEETNALISGLIEGTAELAVVAEAHAAQSSDNSQAGNPQDH